MSTFLVEGSMMDPDCSSSEEESGSEEDDDQLQQPLSIAPKSRYLADDDEEEVEVFNSFVNKQPNVAAESNMGEIMPTASRNKTEGMRNQNRKHFVILLL
jgi:hypothetical protein